MVSVYEHLTNRNIGLLTKEHQQKLKESCVVICGVGGLGGPIAEMLVRMGVGRLKLIDWGTFEPTNLNRQNFCFTDTFGQKKIDVTESYLKKINPEVIVEKYECLTKENIDEVIKGANLSVLCIDHLYPILILSRKCRELGIPLVEGWAIAYSNVRVFTKDSPSLEETYGMPTIGRDVSDISEEEARVLLFESFMTLAKIDGLSETYNEESSIRLQTKGEGTTLAPLVWMTCCMMASESVKIILAVGKIAEAPNFAVYDPICHRIPDQK